MAALRYGCIAVNTGSILPFCLTKATWGGFPGTTIEVRVRAVALGMTAGTVHPAFIASSCRENPGHYHAAKLAKVLSAPSFAPLAQKTWPYTSLAWSQSCRNLLLGSCKSTM